MKALDSNKIFIKEIEIAEMKTYSGGVLPVVAAWYSIIGISYLFFNAGLISRFIQYLHENNKLKLG